MEQIRGKHMATVEERLLRVLSSEEIRADYEAGLDTTTPPPPASLIYRTPRVPPGSTGRGPIQRMTISVTLSYI